MTKTAEEKVAKIVSELRAKGRPVPRTISEIPGFPCQTWEELQRAWKSEHLLLQRFSVHFEGDIFGLFATGGERFQLTAYSTATYLVPLAAIALAFVDSWWWLIGIVFPVIGVKRTKALYNGAIYRAAFSTEAFFCFLYFARQVSVTTVDYKKSYFWNPDEEANAVEHQARRPGPPAEGPLSGGDAAIRREGPAFREFEQEISTWPPEEAALGLQLLYALLSGDKFAVTRLSQKLTHVQFVLVHSAMKRMTDEEGGA